MGILVTHQERKCQPTTFRHIPAIGKPRADFFVPLEISSVKAQRKPSLPGTEGQPSL